MRKLKLAATNPYSLNSHINGPIAFRKVEQSIVDLAMEHWIPASAGMTRKEDKSVRWNSKPTFRRTRRLQGKGNLLPGVSEEDGDYREEKMTEIKDRKNQALAVFFFGACCSWMDSGGTRLFR
jgi:hypothetical protein